MQNFAGYEFTNDWFELVAKNNWDQLIPQIKPKKVLEIGSYEGKSACYLIEKNDWCENLQIFCIDNWEGGTGYQGDGDEVKNVERRFDRNIEAAGSLAQRQWDVKKIKGRSDTVLPTLLTEGHRSSFEFIYVDGSHEAPDVLLDAVLAFKLCKVGGVIAFDDYLWFESVASEQDPIRCPKFAIDAFTNIYCRKIEILRAPLYQIYVRKLSD